MQADSARPSGAALRVSVVAGGSSTCSTVAAVAGCPPQAAGQTRGGEQAQLRAWNAAPLARSAGRAGGGGAREWAGTLLRWGAGRGRTHGALPRRWRGHGAAVAALLLLGAALLVLVVGH